jgi:hypothetical protein
MKFSSILIQTIIAALLAVHVRAWREDADALDGAVGEYVRALRKNYREDASLEMYDSGLHRDSIRRLKRSKRNKSSKRGSKSSKTPAPTTTMAPTCPPSLFVSAPSKKQKISVKSRKTDKSAKSAKSAKSCENPAPSLVSTCPPTAPVAARSTTRSKTSSKSKADDSAPGAKKSKSNSRRLMKSSKTVSFSCKSGSKVGSKLNGKKVKTYRD